MTTRPTIRTPEREAFPIGIVVDLVFQQFYAGEPTINKPKMCATIMRRIYRRVESGEIAATRRCIGEPLMIGRAEVIRILMGDVE